MSSSQNESIGGIVEVLVTQLPEQALRTACDELPPSDRSTLGERLQHGQAIQCIWEHALTKRELIQQLLELTMQQNNTDDPVAAAQILQQNNPFSMAAKSMIGVVLAK